MCAIIINLSSSDSSAEWIDAWAIKFPEGCSNTPFHSDELSSSETSWGSYFPKDCVVSMTTKEEARKKKFDATQPTANEASAKAPVNSKPKYILGIPNQTFCAELGIKPWSPKIPKECSKGMGKKPMY